LRAPRCVGDGRRAIYTMNLETPCKATRK